MPHCEQLSTIESRIRSALITGSYEEATLLLSSYSKQLETELQRNSFQSCELADEMLNASEFLEWIFRIASAAKAHDSARLSELPSISHYRSREGNPCCSWQLEG
jgi:hypothetical protein